MAQKYVDSFLDLEIWNRLVPLRKLYSITLTYILKVKHFKFYEMVRASAKMCKRYLYILTFDIEWCHF